MANFNLGQALSGVGGGALSGSKFGLGGALGGGLLGLLSGFGKGEGQPGEFQKIPTMSPEQQQLLSKLLSLLGGEGQLGGGYEEGLSSLMELMDPSAASQQRFAQPYLEQFEQETVPGIAERFAGMGAQGGALSSSGFGQALGAAGSGLQTQLAGLKSQLQRGAIQDILGQYQGLLGKGLGAQPFMNIYRQPSGGFATGSF